ncbi:hypothetical protein CDAR_177591 [Caerostris darwini]|uniref:Uncharacterized protein n=1 Tax=Caerostris darwini TaxID=1538125 RepID=A0AAV4P2T7_9ARAC|nr:hypothetical protein CDAR_177591 [Caerostris darwini]
MGRSQPKPNQCGGGVSACSQSRLSGGSKCIGIFPPCGKVFSLFVAAQVLEAFAGEVVKGCSDMVARGRPECQWKLRLAGFSPTIRHDIGSLITRDSHK